MRKQISLIMAALFVLWTAGSAFAVEDMGNCNLCKGTIHKVEAPKCEVQGTAYSAWFDYEADATTEAEDSGAVWCEAVYEQFFTFDICECDDLLGGTLEADKPYVLKAEILTEGVYFLRDNPSNRPANGLNPTPGACDEVAVSFYNTKSIMCDDITSLDDEAYENGTNATDGTINNNALGLAYALYTNDGGSNVTSYAYGSGESGCPGVTMPSDLCEDDFANQAKFLITEEFTLPEWGILGSDGSYLLIDLPGYFMDPLTVKAGTAIQVKLYLAEANSICPNCPPLCECVQTIAYVGCNASGASGLFFPYYVSLNEMAGAWWAGLAVVNPGSGTVDVDITFKSGLKEATLSKTIAAGGMEVGLVNNMIADAVGGASFPTDGKIFVEVSPTGGAVDGFAMMGNGYEAQGYLPRLDGR